MKFGWEIMIVVCEWELNKVGNKDIMEEYGKGSYRFSIWLVLWYED